MIFKDAFLFILLTAYVRFVFLENKIFNANLCETKFSFRVPFTRCRQKKSHTHTHTMNEKTLHCIFTGFLRMNWMTITTRGSYQLTSPSCARRVFFETILNTQDKCPPVAFTTQSKISPISHPPRTKMLNYAYTKGLEKLFATSKTQSKQIFIQNSVIAVVGMRSAINVCWITLAYSTRTKHSLGRFQIRKTC